MRVAAGQFAVGADPAENLRTIGGLVEQAAGANAELVVLPEFSGYTARDTTTYAANAEPLDGPFVTGLAQLAKSHRVHLVAGTIERLDDPSHAANTLVLIDDSGALVGAYRKQHLYDAFGYKESDQIAPGPIAPPLTFDLGGLRIGAMTCYDLRFPEMARVLVDAGAEVILLPAQWVPGPVKEDHWQTLLRARAIENTAYVVAAAQTAPLGCGQSFVIDPLGGIVAGGGEEPGVITAELTAERVQRVRRKVPSLENRRYTVVARETP